MAKGGKRPGAGRPKGSITRPQLRDYYSDDEIQKLAEDLKRKSKKDANLLKFVAEQLFGKAAQSIALSDPDGSPLFSSLKDLSDAELERLAAGGDGGTRKARTRKA